MAGVFAVTSAGPYLENHPAALLPPIALLLYTPLRQRIVSWARVPPPRTRPQPPPETSHSFYSARAARQQRGWPGPEGDLADSSEGEGWQREAGASERPQAVPRRALASGSNSGSAGAASSPGPGEASVSGLDGEPASAPVVRVGGKGLG